MIELQGATDPFECEFRKGSAEGELILDVESDATREVHVVAPPGKIGVRVRKAPSGWVSEAF